MSNNDLISVEFSSNTARNNQKVYKDLTSQAVNVIGTSFKGPAFVPQLIKNENVNPEDDVRNNLVDMLGTHRQNYEMHLFDSYLNYPENSQAYHAISTWFAEGREYAYFTRVLGIGSGKRSTSTGKMIGSGFNLSKNISSGTLDNTKSRNLNALESDAGGSIGFVLNQIKSPAEDAPSDRIDPESKRINYFLELGVPLDSYMISSTIMFASGVIPSFDIGGAENNTIQNFNETIHFKQTRTISTQKLYLQNLSPYLIRRDTQGDLDQDIPNYLNNVYYYNIIKQNFSHQELIFPNCFSEFFLEKGHYLYSLYPNLYFVDDHQVKDIAILNTKPHVVENNYPDYNSFECEYQTAKTPWVTSQPIDRSDFGIVGEDDNRENIHEKVLDLFRFWSLDDGEIGNRFRIKINITKCGDKDFIVPNKNDPNYLQIKSSSEAYSTFDIYIFEYDPRVNAFIDLKVSDDEGRSYEPVETFKDLNLNPESKRFIGRVIGTKREYFDFDANQVVTTGFYENKSKYLSVELSEDIEFEKSNKQNMLLPSGFRSYPHIELKKEAFSHYNNDESPIGQANLNEIFSGETNKVYHLPPTYALHYYSDNALPQASNIKNNWGVIFNPSTVELSNRQDDHLYLESHTTVDRRGILDVDLGDVYSKTISPHFYYTKYFLSGIKEDDGSGNKVQSLTKNVWIEEDNYLNSFFHLEKIMFNNEIDADNKLTTNFAERRSNKDILYKHSGRKIRLIEEQEDQEEKKPFQYINLSDVNDNSLVWDTETRELRAHFKNKLSFDFFTYGGFDGVDIRDVDKKHLRNDAIIREVNGEEENSSIDGCTLNSYKKAIDIATKDENTAGDILVVPGITETSVLNKCIDICENFKSLFYIADVSGACSKFSVSYIDRTNIVNNQFVNKEIINLKGVSGNYTVLDRKIGNIYDRDSTKTREDNRFILTDVNTPELGDVQKFYSFKETVKSQFNNILNTWSDLYFQSKYFIPVLGDIIAKDNVIDKKISAEVFVLGQMAANDLRSSLVNSNAPSFLEHPDVSFTLIDDVNLSESSELFNLNSKKAKESGINLIYRSNDANQTIRLLSQNTGYEERNSIFKDQGLVRTVQQIRKRVMFDIFLNESLIPGSFFFGQNSNLANMYQKLDIQLKNLLSGFIEEGLITDYKVMIPKSDDDQTLLDMQNYVLRGSIILQMNSSDIIRLTLNDILQDLSLTADPVSGAILIPNIP